MAGGEDCGQDVGAAKCWQGRAIENREEDKPQCPQVAEHRGNAVPTTWPCILDDDIHHEHNINFAGLFSDGVASSEHGPLFVWMTACFVCIVLTLCANKELCVSCDYVASAPRYCRLFGFDPIPIGGVKMCVMSGHLEWINLYRAALRETDPDKLQPRIEEAERAMRLALRSAVEYEDSDQRHTIGEALRHLETVSRV